MKIFFFFELPVVLLISILMLHLKNYLSKIISKTRARFLHCDELFSDIERLVIGSLRRRLARGTGEVFCRVLSIDG